MTGSGGWPTTVFMTPEGQPFYAGTYFPPEPRHGLPSFRQVLRRRLGRVARAARRARRAGRAAGRGAARAGAGPTVLGAAHRRDPRRGRGGIARVRSSRRSAASGARRSSRPRRRSSSCCAAAASARSRWCGARSTAWPPAACTTSSAAASTATRSTTAGSCRTSRRCSTTTRCSPPRTSTRGSSPASERYRRVVEETLDYVVRELSLEGGGLASAQDADTDGVEGLTYTWEPGEEAPDELLVPWEDGRCIVRGELDPGAARPAARGAGAPAAAVPRRQGDRVVERARARRARRGRLPARARRLARRRRAAWRSSCSARFPTPDGRLLRSWRDGPHERRGVPRRLRERRLRAARAARRDRRAALAGGGAAAGAARRRALRRQRARRLLPLGRRRRRARRADEGPRRQPDPVRELDARVGAAAAGADLGRRRARAARRRRAPPRRARADARADRVRLGALRPRPLPLAAA